MGYSIYIKSKNEEITEKMFSFLKQHLIKPNFSLCVGGHECYFYDKYPDSTSLSYINPRHRNNPDIIGFDFNCSGTERMYMFAILKWMAKIISKTPKKYFYDGDFSTFEEDYDFPISDHKRQEAAFLFLLDSRLSATELDKQIQEKQKFIQQKISTLNKLWNEL